ncbi:hypothetical protein D5085_07165 [Ectothiorhodospiraceae bacterium BW-2]|nr:hypothetical protein D5085_07165 [Ectothiorhodospiraceae bacterium BW-2]
MIKLIKPVIVANFHWVVLASVTILVGLIYFNGLFGPLLLDDQKELQRFFSQSGSVLASTLWSDSGQLGRPLSMLSFSFSAWLFGDQIFGWKLTNLLLHSLIGVIIYLFTLRLLQLFQLKASQPNGWTISTNQLKIVALMVATLWLLHPIHVSTVLYTVQRMTQLSALWVFLALTLYAHILYCLQQQKLNHKQTTPYLILIWLLCFPAALLSKESGVLLPLFILIINITIPYHQHYIKLKKMQTYLALSILLIGGLFLLFNFNNYISGYALREFTLNERLLTEFRVISSYISMILMPTLSKFTFLHDDTIISSSLLFPPTTLYSLIFIVGVAVSALLLFRYQPLISFGLFFFFAGHILESTIFPLEVMFEHRNYLPSFGILLACMVLFLSVLSLTNKVKAIIFFITIFLFGMMTFYLSMVWSSQQLLYGHILQYNPSSPRMKEVKVQNFIHKQKYEMALELLRNSDRYGAKVHQLVVLCVRDKKINDNMINELISTLPSKLDGYALTYLEALATEGLTQRCQVPNKSIIELLNQATKLPMIWGTYDAVLMLQQARFQWINLLQSESLATVRKILEKYPDAAMAPLMASLWLIDSQQIEQAREYYQLGFHASTLANEDYSSLLNRVAQQLTPSPITTSGQ